MVMSPSREIWDLGSQGTREFTWLLWWFLEDCWSCICPKSSATGQSQWVSVNTSALICTDVCLAQGILSHLWYARGGADEPTHLWPYKTGSQKPKQPVLRDTGGSSHLCSLKVVALFSSLWSEDFCPDRNLLQFQKEGAILSNSYVKKLFFITVSEREKCVLTSEIMHLSNNKVLMLVWPCMEARILMSKVDFFFNVYFHEDFSHCTPSLFWSQVLDQVILCFQYSLTVSSDTHWQITTPTNNTSF